MPREGYPSRGETYRASEAPASEPEGLEVELVRDGERFRREAMAFSFKLPSNLTGHVGVLSAETREQGEEDFVDHVHYLQPQLCLEGEDLRTPAGLFFGSQMSERILLAGRACLSRKSNSGQFFTTGPVSLGIYEPRCSLFSTSGCSPPRDRHPVTRTIFPDIGHPTLLGAVPVIRLVAGCGFCRVLCQETQQQLRTLT